MTDIITFDNVEYWQLLPFEYLGSGTPYNLTCKDFLAEGYVFYRPAYARRTQQQGRKSPLTGGYHALLHSSMYRPVRC